MTEPMETRGQMALATMVALFASLGRELDLSDTSAIIWLPDLRLMPVPTAIARLAELRPAVTCVAFDVDGVVSIGVWSGMQPDDFADDVLALVQEEILERWPRVPLDAVDVVVGTHPSTKVRLPWPEFSQWRREYRIPLCEMVVSGRHDGAAEHTLSAVFTPSRGIGTLRGVDPV